MKYDYLAQKDSWEQARLVAYIIARVNSTKKSLKLSDILKFPWEDSDGNVKTESNTSVSNEELDRLKKKAQNYLNNNIF